MPAAMFVAPQLLELSYGPAHPFQLDRAADVLKLCWALDLLPHEGSPIVPTPATRKEIERYHLGSYVDALAGTATLSVPELARWGIGAGDNPVFPGLWESCLLTVGGSLSAARWILDGVEKGDLRRAFHPCGGLHHAHKDRASGFCYVNDPVLAIRALTDADLRVLYVDVDAHHGDGVQEAFYEEASVLTVSIHQDGRTIFPGTGFPNEIGRGEGEGFAVNFPLLPGADDETYDLFREEILLPLTEAYRPDVLVTEIGVDSLRDDPLAVLNWTLAGLDRFLEWVAGTGLPWLAFGGGGYRRWNAIRGWSLVWARMRGHTLPERRSRDATEPALPESWPIDLWDEPPPREVSDPIVCTRHAKQVAAVLRERVLPRVDG